MAIKHVNPEEMIHPLRFDVCDAYMSKVLEGCEKKEDWMTTEELEAVNDYLYDLIASKMQTHYGVTTLQ